MSRFPVLQTIASLLKGLAVLVVVVGFIVGLAVRGVPGALVLGIAAGVYAVVLWAFAEILGVVLAIESNTYASSQSLANLTASGGLPSLAAAPGFATGGGPPARQGASSANASLGQPRRSLGLFPPMGSAATPVQAVMQGFTAGQVVTLEWTTRAGTAVRLGRGNASPAGGESLPFDVPADQPPGAYEIVASTSTGRWGSATFSLVGDSAAGGTT